MTIAAAVRTLHADARRSPVPPVAVVGAPGARLLAGPPAEAGAESYRAHLRRLGPLPPALPEALRAEVGSAGVTGRGGGAFPLARKLEAAAGAGGDPLVVVNGSEGEPASRKDHTLLALRPHLVLDGAAAAAHAVGARDVVVFAHGHRSRLHRTLLAALDERGPAGWPPGTRVRVVNGPDTYLAGESSALAAFLDGGPALPQARTAPLAVRGVGGRPTLISNAETLAHLALVARHGAAWYGEAGSIDAPGSTLVTLAGDVDQPGLVVEVLRPVQLGSLLAATAGWEGPPRAVLVGGYAGTWLDGRRAVTAPVDRQRLPLGCGVIAVLGHERCGLAETARLLEWLDGQSARQCGPCARGLPALAAGMREIVAGSGRHGRARRVHELAAAVSDRGLCHLPDGAALLAHSALETFDHELRAHRALTRRCRKDHTDARSPLPLPPRVAS